MKTQEYLTTSKLAKLLGISRIAVFKKIKAGVIDAVKIGRNYAIPKKNYEAIIGKTINEKQKRSIDAGIKKTVKDYGKTLELLGKE